MSENENNEQESRDEYGSVWQYGKDIGNLTASTQNMAQIRKDIIKFALNLEIKDIRTYSGYKGDLLVEITAMDLKVLKSIQVWTQEQGIKTVIKENPMTGLHELFCITPDEDVYALVESKE